MAYSNNFTETALAMPDNTFNWAFQNINLIKKNTYENIMERPNTAG